MSQTDLFCPHFDQFSDQEFQELFSEVAAIRAENAELFDFTHHPIEVFPSERADESDPPTIVEDEVLSRLEHSRDRNYAIVIEGETGTGKSELCAYLVHQLRDQNRPILRVDKDDDLMSILTERLPEFYNRIFGEELPQAGAFKRLERDIENQPQTVASHAVTGALLKFSKQELDLDYDGEDEQVMVEIVEDQLDELVTKGEYGKERTLISEQQYEREEAFQVFAGNLTFEEAIDRWNTELWNVIRDEYDTPPLSEMLNRIGQKFTDRRPVVVFEDFSIASLEAKQLRNYIERDKKGDKWDFIIAGTRDVTDVMHTQTAEDRFDFFQTNKPNSNSVLFLDEDSAVDFIRPYLAYFKTHDDSVRYGSDENGDRDFTALQDPPAGSLCAECGHCKESFRDLFPFNQTFLKRIYTGLDDSQQSPREYVSKVYDVLQEYYLGGTTVPSSAQALGSDVTNSEIPDDDVYDRMEDFANLAKWYGVKRNGDYEVPREFATAFNLVSPDGSPSEIETGIRVDADTVRIPAAGKQGGSDGGSDGGTGSTGGGEGRSKVERIYDEHLGDVDDWIDDPGNNRFSETNSYIKAALTDLIEHVTEDYIIWTDGSLRYNLSSQKAPFVYGGTASQMSDDQIILDTDEFRPSEVRNLLMHGIRLQETSGGADTDAMLKSIGTHITHYATTWRRQIIDQYIETNEVLYRKADRGRFDFDDFVMATYALVTLLDDPWEPITAERLNERYRSDEDYELNSELESQLQKTVPLDQRESIGELFEYADEIEDLVASRFGVVASSLDVPELKKRLQKATPSRILYALAASYINEISGRVRFAPGKTLQDLATAAYETHATLLDVYEDHNPFEIHEQVLEIFDGIDMDEIEDISSRLSTYKAADQTFVESLSQFANLTESDVNELLAAARKVDDELAANSRQEKIEIMVADLRILGSDVVKRFRRLQDEWAPPSDIGSGSRFNEVSEYYVE